jgi:hypothetical protein
LAGSEDNPWHKFYHGFADSNNISCAGLSWCSGFCNHSTPRIPPTRNLWRYAEHISNASEFIEVHTTGKITRHGHFSFPYSLTNPRKAMTYTLARQDWNDYLIPIGNNLHSKRTLKVDTHLYTRFKNGSDLFSAG